MSENLNSQVAELSMFNDIPFLSNHTSIDLKLMSHGSSPKSLLDHPMLQNHCPCPNKPISAKPIRMSPDWDPEIPRMSIRSTGTFEHIAEDTDNMDNIITEVLHSACKSSTLRTADSNVVQTRTADHTIGGRHWLIWVTWRRSGKL